MIQSTLNRVSTRSVPVSALKGDGVERLGAAILEKLPEGQPYYPQDQLTVQPEKFFVAELIRESIFTSYGEEIPYSTIVEIGEPKEQEGRKDLIRAVIYVERQSQKAILIGKGGEALKRLGSRARRRSSALNGRPSLNSGQGQRVLAQRRAVHPGTLPRAVARIRVMQPEDRHAVLSPDFSFPRSATLHFAVCVREG